jgi:hypothetical protein
MNRKQYLKAFSCLLFAWASLFLSNIPVHAQGIQDMPIQGGNGGGHFSMTCPNRAPMVGIELTAGAWVNSIAGKCLEHKVVPIRSILVNTYFTGSNPGPNKKSATCGLGKTLLGIKYGFTRDGNKPKYVDYVQLICIDAATKAVSYGTCLDSGDGCWDKHPNPGDYNGYGLAFESRCMPQQIAVGLTGRSGAFIDALAMQCTPYIAAPSPPVVSSPGGCDPARSNCSGTTSPPRDPNRCCTIPYSDPLTGAIGTTHTCGPACP